MLRRMAIEEDRGMPLRKGLLVSCFALAAGCSRSDLQDFDKAPIDNAGGDDASGSVGAEAGGSIGSGSSASGSGGSSGATGSSTASSSGTSGSSRGSGTSGSASGSGTSGSSSGELCVPASCPRCVIGTPSCSPAGICAGCSGTTCLGVGDETDAGNETEGKDASSTSGDAGPDASFACEGGSECGGACVDELTDPAHCGSCGNACGAGQTCWSGTCASCQPVLLISTLTGQNAGLVSALESASSAFCRIDYLDANSGTTPTSAFLSQYGAVLAYNDDNFPYSDPTGLGNALAGYFNGGGRVVIALFADAGYPIGGSFSNLLLLDPVNAPLATDSFNASIATEDLVPTSPILAGVTSISGSGWRGAQALQNGAVAVASWASGEPLAVVGALIDANG